MTSLPLVEAAHDLLEFLNTLGRPACLIGGLVVARWGEPRVTQDVDATVLADFGEETAVVAALLSRYRSREADPETFAKVYRLALLEAPNGVLIDVSFAAFPFEREVLDRSSLWQVTPEVQLNTCSAEDLIIFKLVAARSLDIHDVQMVVGRLGLALDIARVRLWGGRLGELLERPDLLDPFEAALRKPGRRG